VRTVCRPVLILAVLAPGHRAGAGHRQAIRSPGEQLHQCGDRVGKGSMFNVVLPVELRGSTSS